MSDLPPGYARAAAQYENACNDADPCDGSQCIECCEYPCLTIDLAGGPGGCSEQCPDGMKTCFDCPERINEGRP